MPKPSNFPVHRPGSVETDCVKGTSVVRHPIVQLVTSRVRTGKPGHLREVIRVSAPDFEDFGDNAPV